MSIRMRHTRGHTGNRRAHHALSQVNVIKDEESGTLRLPHRINEATGMYRGKQIFTPKVRAERKEKIKGPDTEPGAPQHDHTHEHANAEIKAATGQERKGLFSRFVKGGRPKARSGFGGGA